MASASAIPHDLQLELEEFLQTKSNALSLFRDIVERFRQAHPRVDVWTLLPDDVVGLADTLVRQTYTETHAKCRLSTLEKRGVRPSRLYVELSMAPLKRTFLEPLSILLASVPWTEAVPALRTAMQTRRSKGRSVARNPWNKADIECAWTMLFHQGKVEMEWEDLVQQAKAHRAQSHAESDESSTTSRAGSPHSADDNTTTGAHADDKQSHARNDDQLEASLAPTDVSELYTPKHTSDAHSQAQEEARRSAQALAPTPMLSVSALPERPSQIEPASQELDEAEGDLQLPEMAEEPDDTEVEDTEPERGRAIQDSLLDQYPFSDDDIGGVGFPDGYSTSDEDSDFEPAQENRPQGTWIEASHSSPLREASSKQLSAKRPASSYSSEQSLVAQSPSKKQKRDLGQVARVSPRPDAARAHILKTSHAPNGDDEAGDARSPVTKQQVITIEDDSCSNPNAAAAQETSADVKFSRILAGLQPNERLNDEAVSFVLHNLNPDRQRWTVCNTHLCSDVTLRGLKDGVGKRFVIDLAAPSATNLVIPIHLPSEAHWLVALLRLDSRQYWLYDPLFVHEYRWKGRRSLEQVVDGLQGGHIRFTCASEPQHPLVSLSTLPRLGEWRKMHSSDQDSRGLKQRDGFNCGIYCIAYALSVMHSGQAPAHITPSMWREVLYCASHADSKVDCEPANEEGNWIDNEKDWDSKVLGGQLNESTLQGYVEDWQRSQGSHAKCASIANYAVAANASANDSDNIHYWEKQLALLDELSRSFGDASHDMDGALQRQRRQHLNDTLRMRAEIAERCQSLQQHQVWRQRVEQAASKCRESHGRKQKIVRMAKEALIRRATQILQFARTIDV